MKTWGQGIIFVLLALSTGSSIVARADQLNLLRRWAVFPFDTDAPNLKIAAENAWWKSRERITANKKFLVASKQFLIQKDVFQSRRELDPEDVKLLSHLLDADLLVTGFSEGRSFQLNAYLAETGVLFWTKKMSFHPSLRATDQLELSADKLMQDFITSIPYQGFVITDPIVGKTIFEEDGKKKMVVDLGVTDDVREGMEVQWIQFTWPEQKDLKKGIPLFEQSKIQVIADGKVTKVKKGVVTAEIDRAKSVDLIAEKSLVVIPALTSRLHDSYLGQESAKEKNSPELLPTIINPVAPESQGAHKETLVFGSVAGVIGLLLLGL